MAESDDESCAGWDCGILRLAAHRDFLQEVDFICHKAAARRPRRGRHAQIGEVMLGDVICIEAGALAGGDHLQPLGVIARERPVFLVQMIEDAELHWATVKGSAESPAGSAGKRAPRPSASIIWTRTT